MSETVCGAIAIERLPNGLPARLRVASSRRYEKISDASRHPRRAGMQAAVYLDKHLVPEHLIEPRSNKRVLAERFLAVYAIRH